MTDNREAALPAVYVVDDEEAMQAALQTLLGLWGAPCRVFSSAEAVLAEYRAEWTGLLLVDLRMPGRDGLALIRELHARGCRMPKLLMTGHEERESLRQALAFGAIGVLEKPFEAALLKDFLQRYCPEVLIAPPGGAT